MRLFLCYLLALFALPSLPALFALPPPPALVALPPPPALVALPPPVVLPCATACCVKLIAKKEAISAAEITTPHTAIVINFVFSSISIQNIITEYYCCCICYFEMLYAILESLH